MECKWLQKVTTLLQKDKLSKEDCTSWTAYHASKQHPHNKEFILIVLLPLSTESPHSDSMILNGMTVMKQTTNHNNQGLIPFVTMEQPLFAFSDTMQWTWLELHGENKIVVMLGG